MRCRRASRAPTSAPPPARWRWRRSSWRTKACSSTRSRPDAMDASPTIVKATLVPVVGDADQLADAVTVHFNPTSLRLQIQNTMRADTTGGGNRSTAAQHVESSSSTLAIELLFDTTVATGGDAAGSDVRGTLTRIVERSEEH